MLNLIKGVPTEIWHEAKRAVILLLTVSFGYMLGVFRSNIAEGTIVYFMDWNVFLAGIPYALSLVMLLIHTYKKTKGWNVVLLLLGLLWLLFFPNAPYMLTCYIHVHGIEFWAVGQGIFYLPPWYDFIIITSFIWGSVFAGFASLQIIQNITEKHFGKAWGWVTVVTVNVLSSWAIYLGRFVRLNSWDLFRNPGVLLPYIALCRQRILFICLLSIVLTLFYVSHMALRTNGGNSTIPRQP